VITGGESTFESAVGFGSYSGGTGYATISGGDTTFGGNVILGGAANTTGRLNIACGATVTFGGVVTVGSLSISGGNATFENNIIVGSASGAVGTFLISNGVTEGTNIFVGNRGTGNMHVFGGSTNLGGNLVIGSYSSGNGTVTVSGGSFDLAGNAIVGVTGSGTLHVSAPGALTVGTQLRVGANGTLSIEVDMSKPVGEDPYISMDSALFDEGGDYRITLTKLPQPESPIEVTILLLRVEQGVTEAIENINWEIIGVDPSKVTLEWIDNELILKAVVPEPAAAAGVLGLMALLMAARRRK